MTAATWHDSLIPVTGATGHSAADSYPRSSTAAGSGAIRGLLPVHSWIFSGMMAALAAEASRPAAPAGG